MAKKQKRKGPSGIGYIGKKIETEIREFSSDLFFKKAKANNSAGLTYVSFNSEGKLIQEFQGRKLNTLADDNAAITATELVNSGVLTINPTADRGKTIPTLGAMYAFIPEPFSAYDFTIVNTNTSKQLRLARGDTGTTMLGDVDVRPSTSATFRLLNIASDEMQCIRLNSDKITISTAVTLGTIELGHASDTTIARSAAGKVTIESAPIQTTQMSMTHHHFFMNSSSTTEDFFFPYNNLNEANSESQYYTRTIAPYAGKIVKVIIRPVAAIGTACKLQFHKIADTTANFGTATEEVTNIDLNTAETSVSTAFSSATFDAGDVVGVSLIKSASATSNIQAVIVWEYTV